MKKFIRKYSLEIIGVLLGAIAGWCYWYFVGCSSGTCAITSSPINSTIYGSIMGSLFLSLFKGKDKTSENKK